MFMSIKGVEKFQNIQNMVTFNILNRTLFIHAEAYGSAFVIDVDNSEYIVTAKHLLPNDRQLTSIQIRRNCAWTTYDVKEIGRAPGEIDIAVLKIDVRLVVEYFPAPTDMAGLVLGQDVHFVGFPYKLEGDVGMLLDGRPLGYVKKGTVSLCDSPQHPALVLNAINNEGFSGGPVVFAPVGAPPNDLRIAAVVSKYRTEMEQVLSVNGEATGEVVCYNTGFLYAYNIRHAVELILRQS